MTESKIERRDFIKYAVGGVVGLGIGAAGYFSSNSQVQPLKNEVDKLKADQGALGYVLGADGSIATIDLALGKLLASSGSTWISDAGSIDWCNHYPDKNGPLVSRIVLSAYHTKQDIENLAHRINTITG